MAEICQQLSAAEVWTFFERWQGSLPSPFTDQDRARGYRYDLAFRQLEISDTRVFDRPAAGRAWFERTLPDQLTLGRPDRVAVVLGRKGHDRGLTTALRRADRTLRTMKRCEEKIRCEPSTHQRLIKGTYSQHGH